MLIVGLGNPGKEYENTRHNVGFMFIDFMIELINADFRGKKLKNSLVYKYKNIVFAKPQTFMNKSGIAAKELVKWGDIVLKDDFILIHDDLDIPLGKYKFQFAKSPKDHKGVKSVEQHLGTNKFRRLRIGVDNRGGKKANGQDYVLKIFPADERERLEDVFDNVLNYLKANNII